jgi:hypothetical protein
MMTKMNWINFNEKEPPTDVDVLMQIDIDNYVVVSKIDIGIYIVDWNHDVIDSKRFVRWVEI